MNETINNIFEKVSTLNKQLPNQKPFQNNHIFDDLTNHFKDEIKSEDLISMFFYMNILEKSLNQYRIRDLNLGNHNFDKLLSLEPYFKEPIKNGMLSLHSALISYKNYVDGNYTLALAEIDKAIFSAIEQSKSFPYFIIAVGEQWLNKVRIYIRLKDISRIKDETIKLLLFIMYGAYPNEIGVENIHKVPKDHRFQMLQHIINSIDLALIRSSIPHNSIIEIYKTISSNIGVENMKTEETDIEMTYKILDCLNYSDEQFIVSLNKNFLSFSKSPKALQRVTLEILMKFCEEKNYNITDFTENNGFIKTINNLGVNYKKVLV